MVAEEIKKSLKTLTRDELLGLKKSVDELCVPLQTSTPKEDRAARFEKASQEIFSEYHSLLSNLAK